MEEIELLDIADNLLIINKFTIERLFQEDNQNPLILYLFYYKTAKWQKHNPIKANDEYCKKCLHWGIDKVKNTKKRLKEMNLIEIIKRVNEKNIITGWYVKVNYLVDKSTIPETTIPISPLVDKREVNTINNNNKILNNNKYITTTPTIYDFLQENGIVLTPIAYEVVSQWEDNDLTRYAIKQAVLNNKFNINYIDKILYSYQKDNIKTVQQAIEREEEFNNKRDLYYKNKYEPKQKGKTEREKRIEEWLLKDD